MHSVLSRTGMSVCYYSVKLSPTQLNSVFSDCILVQDISLNKPNGILNLFLKDNTLRFLLNNDFSIQLYIYNLTFTVSDHTQFLFPNLCQDKPGSLTFTISDHTQFLFPSVCLDNGNILDLKILNSL